MSDRQPIFHSAVFVLLENELGEFLLQKRQNSGYMDGRYDFSASGHVELDESVYTAATREVQEEIGVVIDPDDLELMMLVQMDVDRAYLNYIFYSRKWQGTPEIRETEKISQLGWYSKADLPDKLVPTMALLREKGFRADTTRVEYVDIDRQNRLIG